MKTKILYIFICLMALCLITSCKKSCNKQEEENNSNEDTPSALNYEDIFLYEYDFDTSTYLIKGIKSQYENLTSYEVPTSYNGVPVEFKYNYEYYTKAKGYFITEYKDGKYLGNEENPYLVLMDTIRNNVETFTIHESTKIIGSSSFEYCYNLSSITFSNNIEYIDKCAFNSSLTNITIPNEWIELWDSGYTEKGNQILSNLIEELADLYLHNGIQINGVKFTKEEGRLYFGTIKNPYYCLVYNLNEEITQVNINEETVIIFHLSLYDEINIKTFTIPSKVEYIEMLDCSNDIEKIYIPSSVKKISSKAFKYLSSEIIIDDDNEWYKSTDGAVYSKDGKKLLHYLEYNENETLYLSDTIEEIYPAAFKSKDDIRTNIKKIIIPNSVKQIGEYALNRCEFLESINIPDGVKILNMLFDYDNNIKNLELGKGISQLNSCYLASNAKIYYNGTLEDFCHIYFENSIFPPNSDFEFYYKDTKDEYVLAESIDLELPKDITYIYYGQFTSWNFLKSINLHSNVTNVEELAFYNCPNLIYNVYENANYLGIGTNKYAILINVIDKDVSNVEIHPDTQIIQDGAFYACDYIESITIPSNVTQVNYAAFSACSNLKEIIFEENSNIVTINFPSIILNQTLEKLILPKQCISYQAIDYKTSKNIYYPGTILEWLELSDCIYNYSVTTKETNFYCLNENGEYYLVDKITLPDNIEEIDYYFDILYPQVTELEITPNIKYIYKIPTKSLYIPSTVLEVRADSQDILYFESTNPQFYYKNPNEQDEWFTTYYIGVDKSDIVNIDGMEFLLKDNFATLTCYKGLGGVVNIPSSIQVKGETYVVNKIGTFAFTDCDNIQYVTIPSSVEMVQNFAFTSFRGKIYCERKDKYSNEDKWSSYQINNSFLVYHSKINELENVVDNIQYNILSNNTVETINYFGTSSTIEIPSSVNLNGQIYQVTKIGNSTFKNNYTIETIILGEYITEIGEFAFYNCVNLSNINVENIKKFERYAFYNCYNAQIIELKSNVSYVGVYAFYNNIHIKNINVTQVGSNSFENCTNLETVTINGKLLAHNEVFKNCINLKTVNLIGEITFIARGAFENCTSLESIKLPNTIKEINSNAFFNCTNLTIYVTTNEMLTLYTDSLIKEYSSKNIKDNYDPEWIVNIINSPQMYEYHTICLVD